MQEETLILKPYKSSGFCFFIGSLAFCALLGVLTVGSFKSVSWAMGILPGVCFLISIIFTFELMLRLFSNAGSITIETTGFSIQTLFQGSVFYSWSEPKAFIILYGKVEAYSVIFSTATKKGVQLASGAYPLSFQDMVDLFKNRQQHFLTGEPLKEYTAYKRQGWWNTNVTISLVSATLFTFVVLLFIQLV